MESFFSIEHARSNQVNLKAIIFNILVVSLKSISQFHSIWHAFTAYASFVGILFLIELDYECFIRLNKLESKERPLLMRCGGMICGINYMTVESEKSKESKKIFKKS